MTSDVVYQAGSNDVKRFWCGPCGRRGFGLSCMRLGRACACACAGCACCRFSFLAELLVNLVGRAWPHESALPLLVNAEVLPDKRRTVVPWVAENRSVISGEERPCRPD